MLSSINTPVRWYDNYFESERFSNDCDVPDFELISDKTRLLPFQFKRPMSSYLISRWFLRKQCQDPMVGLLNTNDSLFTYDTGFWDTLRMGFFNGKIKSIISFPFYIKKPGIFTINKYYTIKIVVNEYKNESGSLVVNINYNTSTPILIGEPNTYTVTFKADQTDFEINGTSLGTISQDYITIESIQIYEYIEFNTAIGDIDLPTSLLSLINLNTTHDLIQYCGNNLPFQIPCGKYYMIMTYGIDQLCYSELLTVKDFIPSQSPFTMIEWTNTCNLADIIYQQINGCNYKNRLYVDSELAKPEYPFKEDGEEDGSYNLNILFKKWEKTSTLMFANCPEFMVDALTGIRLHNTVNITKSLRKKQFQVLPPFEVEKVEYENASIFNDCSTNVELKILLKDKIIYNTCCSNIEITPCFECKYSVTDFDELTGNYYFGNPTEDSDFGFYELIEGDYVLIQQENDVVCITSTDKKYININNEYWSEVPLIGNVVDTDLGSGNHSYNVTGYIYPGTYAKISVVIFNETLGTTITDNLTNIYNDTQLSGLGINILSSLFSVPVPANGTVKFYINNYSLNCDYGTSELYELIYPELHPIVKIWYDSFEVKTDYYTTKAINEFINGLDDDGIIEEFDLLHILAGLQTDDQKLTPLITSSGNHFQLTGGYTFDDAGFKGDGSSGYMNLKWKESDGVKYVQFDGSFGCYINSGFGAINVTDTDMGMNNAGIYSRIQSDSAGYTKGAINHSSFVLIPPNDGYGMYAMISNGSQQDLYENAVLLGTGSGTTLSVNSVEFYLGAVNESGPNNYSSRQIQFVFAGSKLIDQTILNTRFNILKSALGF